MRHCTLTLLLAVVAAICMMNGATGEEVKKRSSIDNQEIEQFEPEPFDEETDDEDDVDKRAMRLMRLGKKRAMRLMRLGKRDWDDGADEEKRAMRLMRLGKREWEEEMDEEKRACAHAPHAPGQA
uniref:RxLR effector protein n=1 Tax=Macrostomum lignano TaxID=282301 RepID=A0A1I8JLM2_9PLAT